MRQDKLKGLSFLFIAVSFAVAFCSCDGIISSVKFMAAQSAYNHAKFDRAIKLYKELLEKNPNDISLNWNLAIAYYSKKDIWNCRKQIIKLKKLGAKDLAENLEQIIEDGI